MAEQPGSAAAKRREKLKLFIRKAFDDARAGPGALPGAPLRYRG